MVQNQLGFVTSYLSFDSNPEIWLFTSEFPESEAEKENSFTQIASVAHKNSLSLTKYINSTQYRSGFFPGTIFLEN